MLGERWRWKVADPECRFPFRAKGDDGGSEDGGISCMSRSRSRPEDDGHSGGGARSDTLFPLEDGEGGLDTQRSVVRRTVVTDCTLRPAPDCCPALPEWAEDREVGWRIVSTVSLCLSHEEGVGGGARSFPFLECDGPARSCTETKYVETSSANCTKWPCSEAPRDGPLSLLERLRGRGSRRAGSCDEDVEGRLGVERWCTSDRDFSACRLCEERRREWVGEDGAMRVSGLPGGVDEQRRCSDCNC